MKKYLITILLILLTWTPAWGTTYYGGAPGKDIAADDLWYEDVTGDCTGTGSPVAHGTVLQAGNTLIANGCTITISDSFTAGTITNLAGADPQSVSGGKFTFSTTSLASKTFTTNIIAGTVDCLEISGTGNNTNTIIGNITGSAATGAADGVYDTHSVGTIAVGSAGTPTTITSGGYTGVGYNISSTTGSLVVTGNAVGVYSPGLKASISSTGSATITGNCTGSDTYAGGVGCFSTGATPLTIVGNIINGSRDVGATGSITWNPTAPANGVTGHYVQFVGGTDVFCGKNTDDATKAKSDFYYIDPTDGTSTVGTAATGGGAWAY